MTKDERDKAWGVRKVQNNFRKERREIIKKATEDFDKVSRKALLEFCIEQGGHFWQEPEWRSMAFGSELAKECLGCGKRVQLKFVNFDGETVYDIDEDFDNAEELK